MKLTVGIPMHNAGDCVIEALSSVFSFPSTRNGGEIQFWALVIDDFSSPDEVQKVRDWIAQSPWSKQISFVSLADQFPDLTSNPNLGLILNACLDQVALDTDYYLNLESDVQLQPSTLYTMLSYMEDMQDIPMTFPLYFAPDGRIDFVYYGAGMLEPNADLGRFNNFCRPKWCNLGCLLIRGDVARDRRCRVEHEKFNLWCVDQDYTCQVAQHYGRPLFLPNARVLHKGRQSTREGEAGGYGHLVPQAVAQCDAKWASYLAGGLF